MNICQKTTKYVDIPAEYKIPFTYDSDGNLSIDYEMSKKDYESYKEVNNAIVQQFKEKGSSSATCLSHIDCSIDKSWLEPIYQSEDKCKAIAYPSPNDSSRTLATWGEFPLIFYTVLRFFGRYEKLENIAQIANYGRWQHDKGTRWHYLDVMCLAYGLEVSRLSNLMAMMRCMEENFITPVLLDNSIHPKGNKNLLVIPTEIRDGEVELYSPAFNGKLEKISIYRFANNVKMVWAIIDPEFK